MSPNQTVLRSELGPLFADRTISRARVRVGRRGRTFRCSVQAWAPTGAQLTTSGFALSSALAIRSATEQLRLILQQGEN